MATLTTKTVKKLIEATVNAVASKGSNFYGWKNSPSVKNGSWTQVQGWGESEEEKNISAKEAENIFNNKLDGAYGERFAMSISTIASLVSNGYNVRLVQFQEEEGTPFDASGWMVIVVETMPVFHVAPWDLNATEVADLVEVLRDNSAEDVSWKNTNKVGEFKALLLGSVQSGLDLVKIAQEASK